MNKEILKDFISLVISACIINIIIYLCSSFLAWEWLNPFIIEFRTLYVLELGGIFWMLIEEYSI